jgi:hemerythrin-like domain-containing protein
MSIIAFMRQHHSHCDELFVAAEEAAHRKDWDATRVALTRFASDTEAHFSAEEERLFPAFEHATGSAMGPTQMMRMEHAQMRGLLDQMSAAVTAGDLDAYAGAAETLLVLLQQHNMKEENILYPMCDRALHGEEMVSILSQRLNEASAV